MVWWWWWCDGGGWVWGVAQKGAPLGKRGSVLIRRGSVLIRRSSYDFLSLGTKKRAKRRTRKKREKDASFSAILKVVPLNFRESGSLFG